MYFYERQFVLSVFQSLPLSFPDLIFCLAGNVENLPFPENFFDIVFGEAITALVPDPVKALKEYQRVLKPGGRFTTLDLFMKESLNENFYKRSK